MFENSPRLDQNHTPAQPVGLHTMALLYPVLGVERSEEKIAIAVALRAAGFVAIHPSIQEGHVNEWEKTNSSGYILRVNFSVDGLFCSASDLSRDCNEEKFWFCEVQNPASRPELPDDPHSHRAAIKDELRGIFKIKASQVKYRTLHGPRSTP